MALQSSQVASAQTVAMQLDQSIQALLFFLQNALNVVNNNFSYTVPGTTDQVTLTEQEQTDMLADYQNLKANLATIYAQLP